RHVVNPSCAIFFKKLRNAEAAIYLGTEKCLGIRVNFQQIPVIAILCKRERERQHHQHNRHGVVL
ncbi:hypothetical protein PQR67_19270, partial [Paraburkholderia fungorum]|uniref:hypothetical protein n=1 Tax=Paraburkholderia fungorum TaxID=134537 RepID=UPI0038B92E6A